MNILWIVNTTFPEALNLLSGKKTSLNSSGGWLLGSAEKIVEEGSVKLSVASINERVKKLTRLEGNGIIYYLIPLRKERTLYDKEQEQYWKRIKQEAQPDVIHIHGTEFAHSLCYIRACGPEKVVISIQGLKSAYYYYYYGLTKKEILRNLTVYDIFKGSILRQQQKFAYSAKQEIEAISKVSHIIGRTSWDKARTWAINPSATYHFCNETLRSEFYDGSQWSYEKCTKHSIFVSQATYPIKGLHQLLRAMPLILSQYPDTTIRIAGADITSPMKIFGINFMTGYGRIIKKLIVKNHLSDKITFVGRISAEGMKTEYLNCNVFISPSTIENSPNSLGEAQILGTPCISSYVGGAMDMMRGNEDNLCRFEEVEMLAKKVCDIFSSEERQINMINIAKNRHNPILNFQALVKIYCSIVNQ